MAYGLPVFMYGLIISLLANYYISKGITRIAVPYFFVASGFFLFRKMPKGIFEWDILKRYCVRLGKIYIAWGIIYLPMVMWQIYRADDSLHAFLVVVRDTIFQGALVYHLWYLYASILAALSLYFLFRSGMHLRSILLLGLLLYMIPVAAYSYHGIYAYFFSDDSIVTIFLVIVSICLGLTIFGLLVFCIWLLVVFLPGIKYVIRRSN